VLNDRAIRHETASGLLGFVDALHQLLLLVGKVLVRDRGVAATYT